MIPGPFVSHKYLTAGKKTVHVTAKNKVHKLEENITVFVNHEIQGMSNDWDLWDSRSVEALQSLSKKDALQVKDTGHCLCYT